MDTMNAIKNLHRKPQKLTIVKNVNTTTSVNTATNVNTATSVNTTAKKHLINNKGTGAGGANTNYYGKKFEDITNNQQRLLDMGYIKNSFTKKPTKTYDYYLSKTFDDKTIVFVLQNGLKMYMKNKYNIELFRCPDEAYVIEYTSGRKVIKILEKKSKM